MRGGAELPVSEMGRVSDLFLERFDGDKIAPGVGGGVDDRLVSTQTGLTGTIDQINAMVREAGPSGLGMEGGGRKRRRMTRRRGKGRGGKTRRRGQRKPRFRLNLRASIRWRQ